MMIDNDDDIANDSGSKNNKNSNKTTTNHRNKAYAISIKSDMKSFPIIMCIGSFCCTLL